MFLICFLIVFNWLAFFAFFAFKESTESTESEARSLASLAFKESTRSVPSPASIGLFSLAFKESTAYHLLRRFLFDPSPGSLLTHLFFKRFLCSPSKKGFSLDHDLVGQTLIQERITFPVISLIPGQVSLWLLEPGHHYQEVEKGNDSSKPYLVEKRCGFSRRAHDPKVVGSNPTSARSFY